MLVELIGVPGSGKSTLLQSVDRELRGTSGYIRADNLLREAVLAAGENLGLLERYHMMLRLATRFPIVGQRLLYAILQRLALSPDGYPGAWGKLSGLVIQGVLDNESLLPQHYAHYVCWELLKLTKFRLARAKLSKSRVGFGILDEGLVTVAAAVNLKMDDVAADQLPHAVILLSISPSKALEQITRRQQHLGRINPSHRGLKEAALLSKLTLLSERYESIAVELKRRGVAIVRHSAEFELDATIESIKELYSHCKVCMLSDV